MADFWTPLFTTLLSEKDIADNTITTRLTVDYLPFLNTLPKVFPPSGKLNIAASVFFNGNVHNHCILQYAVREPRARFKVVLVGNFAFRLNRRLDAHYRWVGALIEIRLQPAVSPQAQVDVNEVSMPFRHLITKGVKRRDLNSKVLRVKRMHVTPFFAICPEAILTAIENGLPFSVQIFPPGSTQVSALLMFIKPVFAEPDYCSGSVDLTNYLANRPEAEESRPQVNLSIWYRVEFGKLELAFTTDQHPCGVLFFLTLIVRLSRFEQPIEH